METREGNPVLDGLLLEVNSIRADIANILNDMQAIKAKATPAPLIEAPADPPPPVDFIEIDPPEDVLQSIEPAKPMPPIASAPAPKELTLDEAKASVARAIAGLDIKGIVEKSISLNLDRLRGRVR